METLLIERDAGVVLVTLNRPEVKNAANRQMWSELLQVFKSIDPKSGDRVLVITGAGDAFCAGGDLSEMMAQNEALDRATTFNGSIQTMRFVGDVALALHQIAIPAIAAVNGVAAGAGVNLAIGCDLVVASESARFAELFVKRGLAVDFGGTWLLPRVVGLQRAKELALLADMITAQEALRYGLVTRVVPDGQALAEAKLMAERICSMAPTALNLTKKMLNDASAIDMEEALEAEAKAQTAAFKSQDFAEGLAAYREKRPAKFTGQ